MFSSIALIRTAFLGSFCAKTSYCIILSGFANNKVLNKIHSGVISFFYSQHIKYNFCFIIHYFCLHRPTTLTNVDLAHYWHCPHIWLLVSLFWGSLLIMHIFEEEIHIWYQQVIWFVAKHEEYLLIWGCRRSSMMRGPLAGVQGK